MVGVVNSVCRSSFSSKTRPRRGALHCALRNEAEYTTRNARLLRSDQGCGMRPNPPTAKLACICRGRDEDQSARRGEPAVIVASRPVQDGWTPTRSMAPANSPTRAAPTTIPLSLGSKYQIIFPNVSNSILLLPPAAWLAGHCAKLRRANTMISGTSAGIADVFGWLVQTRRHFALEKCLG